MADDAEQNPPFSSATIPQTVCAGCGGPCAPPKSHDSWPPLSPLSYRPLRAPALNIPDRDSARASILLTPVPEPLHIPTLSPPFSFAPPSKRISSPSDLHHFLTSSPSFPLFLGFVASLSRSSLRKKISDALASPLSPPLSSLLSLLHTLSSRIDASPPSVTPNRFGNTAFRIWHDRVSDDALAAVSDLLPPHLKPAIDEIFPYFLDSFGSPSRLDYGTGHEANFAAFLFCLARLGVIGEEDYQAVVLRIFVEYLHLMRKLQDAYRLEPAGSHGVWGLDDYHFLPFIFGAAQLVDHKYMKPKSIHNPDILDNFSDEYMYLACVAYVRRVKKGPFAEHSPLLNDISGVPSWSKVNGGLLKMYRAEVLEKIPVMQHFLFGSIIQWE